MDGGILQSIITNLVLALIGIISTILIAALVELRKRVLNWIDNRTSKDQRELLHKIAEEAFSFAESTIKDLKGQDKLNPAIAYLKTRLGNYGIQLSGDEIKAMIEKAVLDYNAKVKPKDQSNVPNIVNPV